MSRRRRTRRAMPKTDGSRPRLYVVHWWRREGDSHRLLEQAVFADHEDPELLRRATWIVDLLERRLLKARGGEDPKAVLDYLYHRYGSRIATAIIAWKRRLAERERRRPT